MSCQRITCCPDDMFLYRSNTAGDALGDIDNPGVAGMSNPNCPTDYRWGGLACVRAVGEICSTGYHWTGSACVPDES